MLALAVFCFRYAHIQHKHRKTQLLRRSHLQMQVLSISAMISEGGMEMGALRQSTTAWEGRQCQSTMKSWQEQPRVEVPTF